MNLTQYSKSIKPYVQSGLQTIDQDGFVIGYDDIEYWSKQSFLDACVEQVICETLYSGDIEKDCDYAEALKLAGIVEGYLQSTNILGKMVGGKIGNIFGKEG